MTNNNSEEEIKANELKFFQRKQMEILFRYYGEYKKSLLKNYTLDVPLDADEKHKIISK